MMQIQNKYKLNNNLFLLTIGIVLSWLCIAFLIYPNINLLIATFFQDGGFTLEPFEKLMKSERAMRSLWNSFILAIAVVITVNMVGLFLVFIMSYFEIKGMKFLRFGYYSTLIYGGIVLVAGYQFIYGDVGLVTNVLLAIFPDMNPHWFKGFWAVLFVMTFSSTSNYVIFLLNALQKVDYQTIEAARNMGATDFQIIRKVILPVLKPTIFALTILQFIGGLGAFAAPKVVGGEFQTITPMILTFSGIVSSRDLAALLAICLGLASMILLAIMTKVESKGNYMSVSKVKTSLIKQKINNKFTNVIIHMMAYVLFVLYTLPVVLIFIFSFTDSKAITTGKLTWDSFTLENYITVFTNASAYQPFLVSIIYSALTAIIVVGLILYIARLIQKHNNRWTAILEYILHIPWMLPSVLIAMGLIITYSIPNAVMFNKVLTGTVGILLIGYIIVQIPFVLRMLKASFYSIDTSLEEAAKNLGASNIRAFFKVLLPIILPSALALVALTFNSTLDEYNLSMFLSHPFYQTLGITIQNSTSPEALQDTRALTFVYTVLLMVISSIVLYLVYGRGTKAGK
ncbi:MULTISPECIES: iron ABC transporter permease [Lysinibacillus]|nr:MULTISPECIES: iron ABC transporter permease [Lysinibacillus]